jgi:membrane protease YdiL (CAAX protease family)
VTIPYFGPDQNVVFVPALLALLAATVLICLPIIFAPALRRSSRRTPLIALAAVFAVVALVGTVWLGGTGFRTLGDERARVQASIQRIYGVRLDGGQVGDLVDGGRSLVTVPAQAAAARLPRPNGPQALKLVPTATGADTYVLTIGGKPWPAA